ncbi:adenylate/guanylate cyclase domain-containing protein [Sphaerisporangium sp. TRM90804]|uniref:adenylate/guanylate cyclase domain-containing protein n=1 Tax=Sphaerisporangium sp. TRM90804 TaxID=3031113 RepID=UPI00244A67D1|nr:adenylate/guanylate cyclase domain-containing protein [Sphaerisporangium sp. TRM90804]MDH2423971.1 adenylate/guanylate cyclase domain-containing protein [Sphaerisporangium sp. TRM90804]
MRETPTAGRPTAEQIERLFVGSAARHTRLEVARLAGVPSELAQRIWRALGFATPADDLPSFTDADVDALRRVAGLLGSQLVDEETVVRLARALGQTTSRLAQWQAEIMVTAMLPQGRAPDDEELAGVLSLSQALLPDFERLLVHVWRAQLAAAGVRLLANTDMDAAAVPGRPTLAVGFADLVSFTQVSRELDTQGLAELVEWFESLASDVVASRGARLVKTLGDEVLFTAPTAETAARVALELVDAVRDDGRDLRVGLSYGPVLPTMGDVFGTTVNLAARLTAMAHPCTVLVDPGVAEAVKGSAGLAVQRIRRRPVRGLGVIQPYVLRRA